ncbi:hypothetical protein GGS20DRAFT_599299 [Poronia punctata]|nr:hypothetical protein GGS20DRAFT_599299 [Poronia punctata]
MRVSYLISAFLATLSIASPIASPDITEKVGLIPKDSSSSTTTTPPNAVILDDDPPKIEETPEYKAAIAAHPGLKKDKYYWFSLEWPLGEPVDDKESKTELQKLQKELGFEHIGMVFGQITEIETGKNKNRKIKRNFAATLNHMIKKNVDPGDTELKSAVWRAERNKDLKWGGETSNKKIEAAKKAAKSYVAEKKIYKVDGNNCNDFFKDQKEKVE